VFQFVFLPGFSTKDTVSELSGRGVGLDVVKTNVEALKGTVTITSQLGRGTSFIVRLPMTLAVTRALMVRANQQTFAIPLDAIQQILRLEDGAEQTIGAESVLKVGANVYPVRHLGRVLNLHDAPDENLGRPPVLLLKVGEKMVALVVEKLLGGREIVIKSLGTHLKRVRGISGATLLGDGSVVLILNPAELLSVSNRLARYTPTTPTVARSRTEQVAFVVDDSPSVRRVLTNLLERNGYKVQTAKDGLEALELLGKSTILPQVVLSDIEMPRMDGYELLGSLRGMPNCATLPVVMITSRAADKHRRKAMDLGASAYVVKPYQDESLLEILRQLSRLAKN
jgi:chemosensory pili system protein ChpA (sensor histidine kinase/response regulator)